jgi:hypothetical protein
VGTLAARAAEVERFDGAPGSKADLEGDVEQHGGIVQVPDIQVMQQQRGLDHRVVPLSAAQVAVEQGWLSPWRYLVRASHRRGFQLEPGEQRAARLDEAGDVQLDAQLAADLARELLVGPLHERASRTPELAQARAQLELPRLETDAKASGPRLVEAQGEDSGKEKQPSGDSGHPIACGVIEAG